MTSSESLLDLVRRALRDFDDVDLAVSCRRAFRVARLAGDGFEAGLLGFDLRLGGAPELVRAEIGALFPNLTPEQVSERHIEMGKAWIRERTPRLRESLKDRWKPDSILGSSVAELERDRILLAAAAERAPDAFQRLQLEDRVALGDEVLDRIRHRTFAYLCDVETRLSVVVATERIFNMHRERVDVFLRDTSAEVLDQFSAAYRRAIEGDGEARAHALTSCRRILKTVADLVCPATGETVIGSDGKSRELTADKYLVRIVHFVSQTPVGDTFATSIGATLEDTGRRLDGLYQRANKGVHAETTIEEVEWCVIQTYLLAGELLQLKRTAEVG